MVKHRVILIVLAVIMIAALYSLPKIVVDNEGEEGISSNQVDPGEEAPSADFSEQHASVISSEGQADIDRLKNNFKEGTEGKRIDIADSLASVYLSYNRYDSAAVYLEYLAENDPVPVRFEKAGDAYYESFGFAMDREKASRLGEKARYFYNRILEEQPRRYDLRNKIAMTYVSSANPMQGITMLRQILEEDPENEPAISNLGMLSIQSGQYERAREYFENLVSINPRNLKGQFYLGLSYYELGQKEDARKQFELVKSMEDDPAVIATADGYLKELD